MDDLFAELNIGNAPTIKNQPDIKCTHNSHSHRFSTCTFLDQPRLYQTLTSILQPSMMSSAASSTAPEHEFVVIIGNGAYALFNDGITTELCTRKQLKAILQWTEHYKSTLDQTKCGSRPLGLVFVSSILDLCITITGSLLSFDSANPLDGPISVLTPHTLTVIKIMGPEQFSGKRRQSDDEAPNLLDAKKLAMADCLAWKELKRIEHQREHIQSEKAARH